MATATDLPSPPPDSPPRPQPRNPSDLFWSFTWLALQGFGGVLAVVQRELEEKKRWMTNEELVEDCAVAAGLIAGVGIKLFVSIKNHPLGRPLCVAFAGLTIVAMAWLRWPLFWILPVIGGAACVLTWRKLAP